MFQLSMACMAYSATGSTNIFMVMIPPTSREVSFTRMTRSRGFAGALFADAAATRAPPARRGQPYCAGGLASRINAPRSSLNISTA
jgi:hypothetical protein